MGSTMKVGVLSKLAYFQSLIEFFQLKKFEEKILKIGQLATSITKFDEKNLIDDKLET